MKYGPAVIAKALVAFVVTTIATAAGLAHGADVSSLDFGQWLAAAAAGLTAGTGVFATPNKDGAPGAAPTSQPADAAINAIQQTVEGAQQAQSDLERLKQAATGAFSQTPVVGPLSQAAIDSLRTPRA